MAHPDSIHHRRSKCLFFFPIAPLLLAVSPLLADSRFDVHLKGSPSFPGGILLVTVSSSTSLSLVEAQFEGKPVHLFPTRNGKTWTGLLGIDLEIRPGQHRLEGRVFLPDEQSFPFGRTIKILSKKFPEQRITVDEKFVTLNPADQKRADEEAQRMSVLWERASSERLWAGQFLRPIPSSLTSGFGRRRIVNGQPRSPHAGVDFKASQGTSIQAANSGTVVLSDNLFFSGNTIVIDHGLGLFTYYAHCEKMAVKEGAKVQKGEIIGTVGATGRVTGPHLHWSCRLNGARVDPLELTTDLLTE
jgi:hypothetical protein